jgi:ABC-type multidrug transport system fused ATPase/permease subunit
MDVLVVATVLLIILTSPHMTASSAGFILAFAGTISSNINWVLVQWRNAELDAISVERTAEYRRLEKEGGTDFIEGRDEAEDALIQSRLAVEYEGWPSAGRLEIDEMSARYGPDMPEILHKISFTVEGGQRVGIVGATGGGKSTLAKALFSFVDVCHGSIRIDGRGEYYGSQISRLPLADGQDIATIPLQQLRSKLDIIAQDPILLSDTLRVNLDIESTYSDEQLYDALHQVQLVHKTPKALADDLVLSEDASELPNRAAPRSPISSTATIVGTSEENVNIFSNLDYEIKSGGEK